MSAESAEREASFIFWNSVFWMIVSCDGDVRSDVGAYLDKAQRDPLLVSRKSYSLFCCHVFLFTFTT